MKKTFLALLTAAIALICINAEAAAPKKIKAPKGVTLVGYVHCEGKPMADVNVSDGVNIVKTDAEGVYRLQSDKRFGTLFISTPAGYQTVMKDAVRPEFWKSTTAEPSKRERHDFELQRVADKQFGMVVCTDSHFCDNKKVDDLKHYNEMMAPALNDTYAAHSNIPMLTFNLGDITWDRWWYETGFSIENVPAFVSQCGLKTPYFGVIGNHDYDAATPAGAKSDIDGAMRFRRTFGPTYYSMNVGDVHIVVLDNIIYKNEVRPDQKQHVGVVGSRNYDLYVDDVQLEWLRQDLQSVPHTTPLVICQHAPISMRDHTGKQCYCYKKGHTEPMLTLLKDYKWVRIFSGHKHEHHSFKLEAYPNIVETNVASIAGELWKTPNKIGKNICDDGSDAGFLCCLFDGKNFSMEVVNALNGEAAPMRLYDMNVVAKRYAESPALQHLCKLQTRQNNYSQPEYADYVYINCWAWEDGSALNVTENGKPLTVEQVMHSDPLAAEAIFAPAAKKRKKESKKTNMHSIVDHMFRVRCTEAGSTVRVEFTNPYGKKYLQTITR